MRQLIEQRIAKLKEIEKMGINPFPYRFETDCSTARIRRDFEKLSESSTRVSLAGRLMAKRPHGKSCFGSIRDLSGDIQIYFKIDDIGPARFGLLDLIEIGDFLGVRGTVFRTRTGEITVRVEEFELLAKAIRPMPEKWHGLRDKETRYRQRYVDLAFNMDVRSVFVKRSLIIRTIRSFLDELGFIEVETPVLQPVYGGGNAEPFVTYHKALDTKLYLRIADELYLKRLLVGGLEKVYEISKDFRNEGIDRFHSPEFTQLELYQAYADYNDMMALFEKMVERICVEVNGSTEITYQGTKMDLSAPWKRLSVRDALSSYAGVDIETASDVDLRDICAKTGEDEWDKAPRSVLIDELISHFVEPNLIEPTFLVDYPIETSPLAKISRANKKYAERFEPFVFGIELGNAFSELNDPLVQLDNFKSQREESLGEKEIDYDFIRALEYGMPPAGGLGVGIDRLVMVLTDSYSIRDVIFFPQMRPEQDLKEEFDGD